MAASESINQARPSDSPTACEALGNETAAQQTSLALRSVPMVHNMSEIDEARSRSATVTRRLCLAAWLVLSMLGVKASSRTGGPLRNGRVTGTSGTQPTSKVELKRGTAMLAATSLSNGGAKLSTLRAHG